MNRSIDLSVDLVFSAQNSKGPLRACDGATLRLLEQRYKRFLALAHEYPERILAPTGDIDEMWHLHMLHPRAYYHDCMTLFGTIVDHQPDFFNADPATKATLEGHFTATEALWEQVYGEPYVLDQTAASEAIQGLGGATAYCIETAAAPAALAGAAYCIKSAVGTPCAPALDLGAAYCIESAAAIARARADLPGAAYCIKASAASVDASAVAAGASYCIKAAALGTDAPTVSPGAAYCVETQRATRPASVAQSRATRAA